MTGLFSLSRAPLRQRDGVDSTLARLRRRSWNATPVAACGRGP